MKTNVKVVQPVVTTHGGARASVISKEAQLRRSVMSNLLWEKEFYEDGVAIAERIAALVAEVTPQQAAAIAVEARTEMHLRHVPLWIARTMAKLPTHKGLVGELLPQIILRADELSEFVALYWKDKKQPLSKQVKIGLAAAFRRFDEYQLAKYNRDNSVKLRDVLFLCHAKPKDAAQEALWKRLVDGELKTPDTWEVALSATKGEGKREEWERLLRENKLGDDALLRNLRNMKTLAVDENLVKAALGKMAGDRILPFRFITAARYAPQWEPELEQAMYRSLIGGEKLPGKTVLVVDVSGSMRQPVSEKSEVTRLEVAYGLSILAREMCDEIAIYATAGNDGREIHDTKLVPPRRGFALRDAIDKLYSKLGGGGIFLVQCMTEIEGLEKTADRVIVLTDEVDCDKKANPKNAPAFGNNNYIINVASAANGIAYEKFTHVNGWSEAVLRYIQVMEKGQQNEPAIATN